MENKGHMEKKHQPEQPILKHSEAMMVTGNQEFIETELCQQLSDTLSLTTLTHTLTPIPSLTDRTISISTNTNDLPRNYTCYGTEEMNQNVKLTNWTTPSFHTSTDDMISSGVFDSDTEASAEGILDSIPKESVTTEEDDAYKWQDISTPDPWDDDEPTLVRYMRKERKIVESSSDDEPRKLRRMQPVNMKLREPSENSYPHSSNCSWSTRDFDDSSTIKSEADEEMDYDSETLVSNWSTRTYSGLDDSPVATCTSISSDVTVTEDIFDQQFDELDENIEHNMIATRYGLPYDDVQCCCYTEAQRNKVRATEGYKLCESGSCCNFEEKYGELDGRAIRLWHTSKRLNGFKKACRIYNAFISKPDRAFVKEFREADLMLKINFPNYWVHLSETLVTFLRDNERKKEHESRKHVAHSCERVLKKQAFFSQHYQVKMRDSGENLGFSTDMNELREDFKLASSFLMKEYPSLFEYLIEKNGFEALAARRQLILENRMKIIEYSKQSKRKLNQLEKKCYQESLEKIKKRNKV